MSMSMSLPLDDGQCLTYQTAETTALLSPMYRTYYLVYSPQLTHQRI